jgi:hypothetical protein
LAKPTLQDRIMRLVENGDQSILHQIISLCMHGSFESCTLTLGQTHKFDKTCMKNQIIVQADLFLITFINF